MTLKSLATSYLVSNELPSPNVAMILARQYSFPCSVHVSTRRGPSSNRKFRQARAISGSPQVNWLPLLKSPRSKIQHCCPEQRRTWISSPPHQRLLKIFADTTSNLLEPKIFNSYWLMLERDYIYYDNLRYWPRAKAGRRARKIRQGCPFILIAIDVALTKVRRLILSNGHCHLYVWKLVGKS